MTERQIASICDRLTAIEGKLATMHPTAVQRFYTVAEACKVLAVSRWTLDELAAAGELRKVKIAGSVRFFVVDVERYIGDLGKRPPRRKPRPPAPPS